MDDKEQELALLVAKDLKDITPTEVEAEFKKQSKHGKSKGFLEIFTVVGLLVRLVRFAVQFWTSGTTEQQLIAALEATAASADRIDKKKRDEIIDLIVVQLKQWRCLNSA